MAKTHAKRGRGRPPNFVREDGGHPPKDHGPEVHGLSFHQPTRRYYATYSQPREYFGTDKALAISRFRVWEKGDSPLKGQQIAAGVTSAIAEAYGKADADDDLKLVLDFLGIGTPEKLEQLASYGQSGKLPANAQQVAIKGKKGSRRIVDRTDRGGQAVEDVGLDPGQFWNRLGDWLRAHPDNPRTFGDLIGLPEFANLAYLDTLKPREDATKLKRIAELWDDRDDISDEHQRKCRDAFALFIAAMKPARTVAEVTADQVKDFRAGVRDSNLAPRTIKNLFENLRAPLLYAQTEEGSKELNQLVDYTKKLRPPKQQDSDPEIISKEDFQALLDNADTMEAALLLLSMNAALTPVDLERVNLDDINLDKRTFVGRRQKTGRIVRAAILWPRTVAALKRWLKDCPDYTDPHDKSKPFFATKHGRLSKWTIRERFRDLRKEAEISDDVKLYHARKSAATAADEAGSDEKNGFDDRQVNVLLGHKAPGVRDEYVKRNPGPRVAKASEAVEAAYFDEDDEKPKPKAKAKAKSKLKAKAKRDRKSGR